MVAKITVASAWLDACSGCHMSILDLDEAIIDLTEIIEFKAMPITDIKEFSPVDLIWLSCSGS